MFLAAFGFFAAVVFLPRWFQVVDGTSATDSGYQMLPLLGGLIVSAVASGQIVSRTGRYRLLDLRGARRHCGRPLSADAAARGHAGPGALGVDVRDRHRRRPDVRGVPAHRPEQRPGRPIGAATSSLTFFQQVGGTVGLAITGTVFASSIAEQVPRQIAAAEVPPQVGEALAGGGRRGAADGRGRPRRGVPGSLPEAARAQVEPFVPAIVGAIHSAFSIATASTFAIGIATSLVAAGLVLLLREAPAPAMATSPAPAQAGALPSGGQQAGYGAAIGQEIPVSVEIEGDTGPGGRY